jgi:hypothetical protein
VQEKIQAVADFLAKKRAKVSDRARPDIDTNEAARAYIHLLRAATSGRGTQEEFDKNVAAGRGLPAGDDSYYARMLRGSATSHRDWLVANEVRHKMRYKWADFFKEYDLLLCPAAASAAFPHDHEGERHERTIEINGRRVPTTDQLFWAGYPGMAYLPARWRRSGRPERACPWASRSSAPSTVIAPAYRWRGCSSANTRFRAPARLRLRREIPMEQRTLGKSDLRVSAIGLGPMSMSGTYGKSDDEQSIRVIHAALDRGVNFLDSSDLYGWGHNEQLLKRALLGRRKRVVLATKFGNVQTADGKGAFVDGRPAHVARPVTRASSGSAWT